MQRKSIVVDLDDAKCAVCGKRRGLQYHHIIHGTANRKISDNFGLTCYLCMDCHKNLHDSPDKRWRDIDNELKKCAQRKFMDRYGESEWLALFGKNYIDD